MRRATISADLACDRIIAAIGVSRWAAGWGRWLLRRRYRMTPGPGRRRQLIGCIGEAVARHHLQRQHYRLMAANLADATGEIDLLAIAPQGQGQKQAVWVLVEVKCSLQSAGGKYPEARVNAAKAQRMLTMAHHLARRDRWRNQPIRLDIVAILLDPQSLKPVAIRHHIGAIQAAGW